MTTSDQKKKPTRRATGPKKIVLDSSIKISNVLELKALLQNFLTRKQITIDASKVEKIDTSALQLLTAFIVETNSRSIKITWQSPSPYFVNSAKLLGLVESIKLPAGFCN